MAVGVVRLLASCSKPVSLSGGEIAEIRSLNNAARYGVRLRITMQLWSATSIVFRKKWLFLPIAKKCNLYKKRATTWAY